MDYDIDPRQPDVGHPYLEQRPRPPAELLPDPLGSLGAPISAEIASALVKAQAFVEAAEKDGENTHSGFSFASREGVARVAKAALAKAELAFPVFGPFPGPDGTVTLICSLVHEGGTSISWRVSWPMESGGRGGMSTEQRIGSAISYAHKNVLLALLNIPRGGEELDAQPQRRDQEPPNRPPVKRGKRREPPGIDREEAEKRRDLVKALQEPSILGEVKKAAKAMGLGGSLLTQTTEQLEELYRTVFKSADKSEDESKDGSAGPSERQETLERLEAGLRSLPEGPRQKIEGRFLMVDGELVALAMLDDEGLRAVESAIIEATKA